MNSLNIRPVNILHLGGVMKSKTRRNRHVELHERETLILITY